MNKLHETIKLLRNKAGFSQDSIADVLGINQSSYAKIERGETELTLSRLQRIASLFNLSVIELLTYDNNKEYGSLVVNNNQNSIGVQNNYAAEVELKQEITDLKNRVRYLEERVNSLTEKNALKDKIISLLEGKKEEDMQNN
jgi:transcriptional regulator with XRE-family HTH domain